MIPPKPGRRRQPLPSHAGLAQDSRATPLGIDGPEACARLGLNDSTYRERATRHCPFSFPGLGFTSLTGSVSKQCGNH